MKTIQDLNTHLAIRFSGIFSRDNSLYNTEMEFKRESDLEVSFNDTFFCPWHETIICISAKGFFNLIYWHIAP